MMILVAGLLLSVGVGCVVSGLWLSATLLGLAAVGCLMVASHPDYQE